MAKAEATQVTMRIRVGDSEVEVTGPVTFVEKKVAEFLASRKGGARSTPVATGMPDAGDLRSRTPPGKKMAVAQFFKRAGVKSDVDRVLAAGYYLENSEERETFTTAEIVDTIRKAKCAPPKNPSENVAKNIKKGLMMPSGDKEGKGAYVLTTDGEEAIRQLLNS